MKEKSRKAKKKNKFYLLELTHETSFSEHVNEFAFHDIICHDIT